jgi:hypothetical protein
MGPEEEVRKSNEQEQRRATGGERIPQTLDELAALSHPELLKLYSRATVPPDMKALDGQLHGRLLAVRGTDRPSSASSATKCVRLLPASSSGPSCSSMGIPRL